MPPKKLLTDRRCGEIQVRTILENMGFGSLHSTLKGICHLTSHCVTRRIDEIFWDTTDTLHLCFEEMTITPFDFAVLTGLGFSGGPFVCQEDFHHDQAHLFELFGPTVGNIPYRGSFSYNILFTLMQDDAGWAAQKLANNFISFSLFSFTLPSLLNWVTITTFITWLT